jgi:hypothetical protein
MLIGSTQAIKRPKGVERVLSVLKIFFKPLAQLEANNVALVCSIKKIMSFWLLKGYKGKKKHKGVKKGVEMARLFFNQS